MKQLFVLLAAGCLFSCSSKNSRDVKYRAKPLFYNARMQEYNGEMPTVKIVSVDSAFKVQDTVDLDDGVRVVLKEIVK